MPPTSSDSGISKPDKPASTSTGDHDFVQKLKGAIERDQDLRSLRDRIAAALDSDVRLLVYSTGVTLDGFNEQFPGVLQALANRATAAVSNWVEHA